MMKKVRNSAMPVMTMFGGVLCVCIAVRRNPRTMTIRVKQVIMIRIDGASAISVSSMIISRGCEASTPISSCITEEPASLPT